MKLGNSNGNNRGKKYFLRKNCANIQPTNENRNKADVFGEWFTDNINALTNFLKLKLCYDEDVFATTFMRMYEKILFTSMDVKDYKAYFHRSYQRYKLCGNAVTAKMVELIGRRIIKNFDK